MRKGFTLVELSVVIVIIALIVGGIVIGQELVAAAGLRATIAQVESYNAAVHTFREKYGGLPGDIAASQASAFGLFALDDGMEVPNGNDQVDLLTAANPNRAFSGEVAVFWRHLSEAGLIDDGLGLVGNSEIDTDGTLSGVVTLIDQSIPPARIGRGNFITVYAAAGVNYFEINAIARLSAQGVYQVDVPGLLPTEAYSIDLKIDDGAPTSGVAVARGQIGLTGALNQLPDSTPSTSTCVVDLSAPTVVYALTFPGPACALRIALGN
jgi:prepilin-type N-terminal cleavage/methylation domain-containing protein